MGTNSLMTEDWATDEAADAEKMRLKWKRVSNTRCPRSMADLRDLLSFGEIGDRPVHQVWAHRDGRRLCEVCASPEMWVSAPDITGAERALLGHRRCRVCGEWEAELGGREPAYPGCWVARWLREPVGECGYFENPDGPCENRCALDHPPVAEAAHRLLAICDTRIDDNWHHHNLLLDVGPWTTTASLHTQSVCEQGQCARCLPAEAEDAHMELTRAVYMASTGEALENAHEAFTTSWYSAHEETRLSREYHQERW